jgi:tetratricopeptide (TPR) repeat protein
MEGCEVGDEWMEAANSWSDQALADKAAGRLDDAQTKIDQALEVFRQRSKSMPDDASVLAWLSFHLCRAVQIATARGCADEALALVEEQCELGQRNATGHVGRTLHERYVDFSLHCIGDAEAEHGRLDTAIAQYERAANLAQRRFHDDPESIDAIESLARATFCIADVDARRSGTKSALEALRRVEELVVRLQELAGDTPNTLMARSVVHDRLTDLYDRIGLVAEASVHARKVLDLLHRWQSLDDQASPLSPALQCNLATGLAKLARLELKNGRPEEALALCQTAKAHAIAVGSDHRSGEVLGPQAMCDVLQVLGDAQWSAGEIQPAQVTYIEHFEVSSAWIERQQTVKAFAAHLASLQRMAKAERAFGDTARSYEYSKENLAHALKFQDLCGETIQVRSALMFSYQALGDLEVVHGQLDAARANFERQMSCARRLMEMMGASAESLLWLGSAAERVGDVEKLGGRFDDAMRMFELKRDCVEKRIEISGRTPELIHELLFCLLRFGDLAVAEGDLRSAMRQYEAMHELANQLIEVTGRVPESLRQIAISHARLGTSHAHLAQLDQAYHHHREELAIAHSIRAIVGDTLQAVRDESVACSGLATIERQRFNWEAARGWYTAQIDLVADMISRTFASPELIRDLSTALWGLSQVHMAGRGERELALSAAKRSVGYLVRVSDQLATWAQDAVLLGETLTSWVMAGVVTVDDVWPMFRQLWRGLHGFIDLNRIEVIERNRSGIDLFLGMWMDLACLFKPERLPEVLAARQGRKLLSLKAEEDEGLRSDGGDDPIERVRVLRMRLRGLALEISKRDVRLDLKAARDGVAQPGLSHRKSTEADSDAGQAIRRLYDETQKELEQCRADAAESNQLDAERQAVLTTEQLQGGLSRDEGLLVLIQIRGGGSGWEGDPHCVEDDEAATDDDETWGEESGNDAGGSRGFRSWALLLTSEGHVFTPLPGLEEACVAVRNDARIEAFVIGNRFGAMGVAGVSGYEEGSQNSVARPSKDLELSPDIGRLLWTPLGKHLQGIQTLNVVTHSELHLIPLHEQVPAGLRVHHFPGLVFYRLQKCRNEVASSTTKVSAAGEQPEVRVLTLALHTHSPEPGEALPPIPFVDAEAQALQHLWSRTEPLVLDRETYADVLHVAGHGSPGQGEDAGVLIGRGHTLGLHGVLRSGLRGRIAVLNACTVGQVSEDLDGDPVATLTGLFLRGYREIVAPLVPVNDFFSGIFAALLHAALQAQDPVRLDAHQALQQAKAQLRGEIEWPELACQAIEQAYAPVMQRAIEGILEGGGDVHTDLDKLLVQWLRPMYSYSYLMADKEGPFQKVVYGNDAEAGARVAAKLLVAAQAQAGLHKRTEVQTLLRHVSVFGAPAR